MADHLKSATVGEIVAADYRAAGVMERFGIDFCCGGDRSLTDACGRAEADPATVLEALGELSRQKASDADLANVGQWPLDRLIDHIVTTHHGFVREALPRIAHHLSLLRKAHGDRHPELACVGEAFDQMSGDLERHLMKEEQILFPYVQDLVELERTGGTCPNPFGTVVNPIAMMEREHQDVAETISVIRALTHKYEVPSDGCTTYAVCMAELEEFERDLHRHVHLENNVLFPRAVDLESSQSDD
jgi:regulator of cell morphogenesis and NO signaling